MTEFEIIRHYFASEKYAPNDVDLGIGDDAALVRVPSDQQLVVTTDTLIAGLHFPLSTSAFDIGYKSLAVNLSDLAAMGARPAWFTLALSLPNDDKEWLEQFSQGLFNLARSYNLALIGGDLTRGSLAITIQALGLRPISHALLRSQAKVGDLIYVTGHLGDAGLALRQLAQSTLPVEIILNKLNRPEPRIAHGQALLAIAHAAIDISDGLAADLRHILNASQVGAKINVDQLPLSPTLQNSVSHEDAITLALTAGDDYELCFTLPANAQSEFEKYISHLSPACTCIGEITAETGLYLHYQDGSAYHGQAKGYQHF